MPNIIKENKLTSKEIIAYWLASKPSLTKATKKGYAHIAQKYLTFCFENKYSLSRVSIDSYLATLNGTKQFKYKESSCTKQLLKFCEGQAIALNLNVFESPANEKPANSHIELLIKDFCSNLDVNDKSIETYKSALNQLNYFMTSEGLMFKKSTIISFKKRLASKVAVHTINNYLASIRAFCRYLLNNIHLFKNPNKGSDVLKNEINQILEVKNYKIDSNKFYKKPLTEGQVNRLFELCQKDKDLKAIAGLMVYGGLRIAEVCKVAPEDFKTLNGVNILYVQGKGRQQKTVFVSLTPTLVSMLDETKRDFRHYKPGKIRTQINIIFGLMGIKEPYVVTPHSLRHTCAKNLVNQKGIEYTKRHLRHSSLTNTQVYTLSSEEEFYLKNT